MYFEAYCSAVGTNAVSVCTVLKGDVILTLSSHTVCPKKARGWMCDGSGNLHEATQWERVSASGRFS